MRPFIPLGESEAMWIWFCVLSAHVGLSWMAWTAGIIAASYVLIEVATWWALRRGRRA